MQDNHYIPQIGEEAEFSDNTSSNIWRKDIYKGTTHSVDYPYDTQQSCYRYCRKIINQVNQPNKSLMSTLKQTMKRITRKEPEKTFVRVGFIDENEDPTDMGKEALQMLLWGEYQTKLKELADKIDSEGKADSK